MSPRPVDEPTGHRLLVATLLVPLWIALRPHAVMDMLTPSLETALGRLVLVLFLAAVVTTAWPLMSSRLRPFLSARRGRLAFAGLFIGTFVLYALPAGLVARGDLVTMRLISAHGPLVPWPTLEAPLVGDWVLRLGSGHLLVALVVALLASSALLVALSGRVGACGRTTTSLPALLLGVTCPGCLPLLLLPLAAVGLAAPLALIADPTAPASALLLVAAPLLALLGLHVVIGTPRRALRPFRWPTSVSLVALPLAYAGLPRGASGQQELIHTVYLAALIGAVILVGAVFIGLAVYLVRYRASTQHGPRHDESDELSAPVRRALIASFLLVPAAVIFGIGIYSHTVVLPQIQETPEDALHVDVIAAQFAWEFHYPDGNMTRNDLFVPMGEAVVLNVTTKDVVHSLFIPEMGIKIDAMPGRVNHVNFEPQRTGAFQGYCAEHCGVGHSEMLFTLHVVEEGYDVPFEA